MIDNYKKKAFIQTLSWNIVTIVFAAIMETKILYFAENSIILQFTSLPVLCKYTTVV